MIEILKKYLVLQWWIPVLLFILSIVLFLGNYLFPETDLSFYLMISAGFILLLAGIWQFFAGSKFMGVLQLSVFLIPMFFFGHMVYLFSGMLNKPDGELSIARIEPLIKEKTGLNIPKEYEISENLIEHTQGAFDSDYSIDLKIKYQESDEKYVTEQIHDRIKSKSEKGIWKRYVRGFDFEHSGNDINRAEPFYFKVDTLSNTIELNLMHL
jgi:hypothetical protein